MFIHMKKILSFAATAMIFASCGSNQQTTDKANQAKIDAMSQAMEKQHIIDSMNTVNTINSTSVAVPAVPERRSRETYAHEHNHAYSGAAPANTVNNPAPVYQAPAAPPVVNTVIQPTPEDIAAQKKADHKKELKSSLEGALIGGGAGAIGGALSGKNKQFKEQDAAIGGGAGAVLGAGAGYLLERHKLKKDTTRH